METLSRAIYRLSLECRSSLASGIMPAKGQGRAENFSTQRIDSIGYARAPKSDAPGTGFPSLTFERLSGPLRFQFEGVLALGPVICLVAKRRSLCKRPPCQRTGAPKAGLIGGLVRWASTSKCLFSRLLFANLTHNFKLDGHTVYCRRNIFLVE